MAGVHWKGQRVGARAVPQCVLILVAGLTACEVLPQRGDQTGLPAGAQWAQHGHLIVERDPRYTIVRLRVDTTGITERHDVLLARFDFDPSEAEGDEYELTVALDIGNVIRLAADHPSPLGDSIPAYATVTCLCRPLRPDSVRATYTMQTSGIRQLAGRIDEQFYFPAWHDSTKHNLYRFRQTL